MAENDLRNCLGRHTTAGAFRGPRRTHVYQVAGKVLSLYCVIYSKYCLCICKVELRCFKFNAEKFVVWAVLGLFFVLRAAASAFFEPSWH